MVDADFDRFAQSVGVALDARTRLPSWPFKYERAFAHILEFERILSDEFAEVLRELARTYGDRSVTTIVLEPSPRYYSESYGIFPGFRVEASSLEVGYGAGLRREPGDDPTGALAYTADVVAIAGSSGCWAVWGQRDWEIALLCTPQDSGPWRSASVPLFERNVDLDSLRSPTGWGLELSEPELVTFWENVRARGSGGEAET